MLVRPKACLHDCFGRSKHIMNNEGEYWATRRSLSSVRAVLPTGMVLTLDAIPGRLCFAISVGTCWDILETFFSFRNYPFLLS